jgi:hypothetical protein
MSIGPSGRIVIEIAPELKRDLHAALLKDGITLKDWFIAQSEHYVKERQQLSLGLDPSSAPDITRRAPR